MMLARIGVVLAIGLMLACQTLAQAEWPQSGVYFEKNVNSIYEGEKRGWRKTQTTDCLSIKHRQGDKRANKNRIDVEVNLIQTNAHLCTFSGSMIQIRPDYWEVDAQKNTEAENTEAVEENCKLGLEVKSNKLVLRDPDWQCRDYYCGARASFDGAAFYTSSRLLRNKNISSCFQD